MWNFFLLFLFYLIGSIFKFRRWNNPWRQFLVVGQIWWYGRISLIFSLYLTLLGKNAKNCINLILGDYASHCLLINCVSARDYYDENAKFVIPIRWDCTFPNEIIWLDAEFLLRQKVPWWKRICASTQT